MPFLTPEKMRELEEVYANIPIQKIPETRDLTRISLKPLSAYPLPARNYRRGMHGTAEVDRPLGSNPSQILSRLADAKFSTITILMNPGGDNFGIVDMALALGFSVNVRMYRHQPYPDSLTGEQRATLQRVASKYRGKPVYFITGNEGDLPDEWKGGQLPSNWLQIIARCAITDARFIQGLGLIPVLPAAATGSPGFYRYALIPMILSEGGADIFNGLIIFGVHNYCVGHPIGGIPYEDKPYPYDSVNQAGRQMDNAEFRSYGDVWRAWETDNMAHPNAERARNKNPNQKHTDLGGASGWIAVLHQWEINVKAAGLVGLPVISTEGGEWHDVRNDGRYPRTNPALRVARELEIAKRAANKSSLPEYNFPDWYLSEAGDWLLEDDRAHSPWRGGGYFSFGVLLPEYVGYFSEHARIVRHIDLGSTVPPPDPEEPEEPGPSPLPPRVLDPRLPALGVTLTEAVVQPGQWYWRIESVIWEDESQSGGRHHIYLDMQNADSIRMVGSEARVVWADDSKVLVIEAKPGEEFGANFPMFAAGCSYMLQGLNLPTDRLNCLGLGDLEHRDWGIHVAYKVIMRKRQMAVAVPLPQVQMKLFCDAEQEIQLNPKARIQKEMFRTGYVPNMDEITRELPLSGDIPNGQWVMQRGERMDTGEVKYFGCPLGVYHTVYWTDGDFPIVPVPGQTSPQS